jgi:ADP-heptose:LPS heptosyltransferase
MLSLKQVFSSLWHKYIQHPQQQKKKLAKIKEALQLVQSIPAVNKDGGNKQLLIVRVDDIGDYLLFRNALQIIRNSNQFKDYKITLLGNEAWKDISIHFDQAYVDDFIWLNKHSFFNDKTYQNTFLTVLKNKPFEMAFFSSRTRYFLLEDIIAMAVNTPHKMACHRQYSPYETDLEKEAVKSLYQQEILLANANMHEFDFNMKITEFVTNELANFSAPILDTNTLPKNKLDFNNYVVIFPGASAGSKRWSPGKFAKIVSKITENKKLKVVIAGSKSDQKFSKKIIQSLTKKYDVIDYCGQTNLLELIRVINDAKLLISNDTSAAHMGACLGVNTIVLANGNHFGRFMPYSFQATKTSTIYPQIFNTKLLSEGFDKVFNFKGRNDIQTIKVKAVLHEMNKILG